MERCSLSTTSAVHICSQYNPMHTCRLNWRLFASVSLSYTPPFSCAQFQSSLLQCLPNQRRFSIILSTQGNGFAPNDIAAKTVALGLRCDVVKRDVEGHVGVRSLVRRDGWLFERIHSSVNTFLCSIIN